MCKKKILQLNCPKQSTNLSANYFPKGERKNGCLKMWGSYLIWIGLIVKSLSAFNTKRLCNSNSNS